MLNSAGYPAGLSADDQGADLILHRDRVSPAVA